MMTGAQSRSIILPALIVAICGALVGHHFWRTLLSPLPKQYSVDFTGADWIETHAPNGYFRKELFIPTEPTQAWIQIGATDAFDLYINGDPVASETFVSTVVTGVYDLTGLLTSGKNVVAVRVRRQSGPGAARLIGKGAYREASGRWREFVTDSSWKVSSYELQGPGMEPWHSKSMDSGRWQPAAVVKSGRTPLPMRPIDFDPRILQLEPAGSWISPLDDAAEALFTKRLSIRRHHQDAWIGIGSSGGYELSINGDWVVSHPVSDQRVTYYRITDRLKAGDNAVWVHAGSESGWTGVWIEGAVVYSDGTFERFQSDHTWGAARTVAGPVAEQYRKEILAGEPSGLVRYRSGLLGAAAVIGGSIILIGLWRITAYRHARKTGRPPDDALSQEALLHLPVGVIILGLWILSYDVRLTADFPFRPWILLSLVAALGLLKVVPWIIERGESESSGRPIGAHAFMAPLALIVLLGFGLRIGHLDRQSLTHDEVSMIKMARGILTAGYPHAVIGEINKPLTTYELIPYPIALSASIFGWTEWGVRLPSVLFGTATILLIGVIGSRLMNRETGLLSSAVYALLPWSIEWSRNAFYPQQTQMFALGTFGLFYLAVQTVPFDRRYLRWATAAFILTYLSWEGTGFILPALTVAVIGLHPRNFKWLMDGYLWRCIGIVVAVVVLQQVYRMLSTAPYLAVGAGLSQVGLPTPFFLDPQYDPYFYVTNFLWLENHGLLTLLAAAGIPFVGGHNALRYLILLLIVLVAGYTNLLSAQAGRYVYYLQPLLILSASGVLVSGLQAAREAGSGGGIARRSAVVSIWALIALVLLSTHSYALKLYRLGSSPDRPIQMTRPGLQGTDYRSASEYVKAHWRPGDVVIPAIPHTFEHYTGLPSDYFLDTLLAQRVIYDTTHGVPVFSDRFSGSPVIRNLSELNDVLNRSGRVWIIAAPASVFEGSNDPAVIERITGQAKVMFESYEAKVYLWEGAVP
jgi:hypothetical protein